MAGTLTHHFFAEDLYTRLPQRIKNKIGDKKLFQIGANGPDIFFFNAPWEEKVGLKMHQSDTKKFFMTFISYIQNNHLESDLSVIAFLYGFISHYFLDIRIHPFVYYKTGIFDKGNPETYQYRDLHHNMEVAIDAYYIDERTGIKPSKFLLYPTVFQGIKITPSLKKVLDDVIFEVYHKKKMGQIYPKSLKRMGFVYRFLRQDRFGIKKKIYRFIDFMVPKKYFTIGFWSYAIGDEMYDYLNLEHDRWNHPFDKHECYIDSVLDLYQQALEESVDAIMKVDLVLSGKQDISVLDSIFYNLSYSTGKDCQDKRKMKYFED